MVKGRKVLQIICEVPLEAQGQVFAALGAPMPDAETWVAIARLRSDGAPIEEPEQLEPPRPQKSLAQIAGIVCAQPAFWKYIQVDGQDAAAEYVRGHCNISSRAALDSNEDAALAFRTLNTDYKLWLDGIGAAA